MGFKWLMVLSLLLVFFLNSCGGAADPALDINAGGNNPPAGDVQAPSFDEQFADWIAGQNADAPEGMSDLPPFPLEFGKGASEGEGGGDGQGSMTVPGSDFLLENGATIDGSSAVLHVGADSERPAFALYRFSGLLDTRPLSLNVECMPGSLEDRYYVGIADYSNLRWRWFGPSELPEFPIDLSGFDWNFISNLGNMYFVIAVPEGGVATHSQSTLLFGPNEPPSMPGCPTELVASDGEFAEGVALSWNPAHGAEWYRILRRQQSNHGPMGGVPGEGDGEFGFIGESVEPYFFDETAEPGVVYEYKVEARNSAGKSCFSNIDSGFAGENGGGGGEFDLFGAWIEENTAIVLEWGGPEQKVFTVWKAVGEGEFDDIATTDDHRFVDLNVEHNVVYRYKVSYVGPDGGLIFSNIVQLVFQGEPIGGFDLFGFFSEDKSHVVLEWQDKETHTGYDIFRRTGDGEWVNIGETAGNRFEDHEIEPGVHYYYKVKAWRGGMEPEWSNEVHLFLEGEGGDHCDFELFGHFNEGGTAVLLEWEVVEGHTGYMVQKRIGDGEWFNLDDTSQNHFTDEQVEPGVWYAYRIKAFRGENLEPCMSNVIELFRQGEGGGEG